MVFAGPAPLIFFDSRGTACRARQTTLPRTSHCFCLSFCLAPGVSPPDQTCHPERSRGICIFFFRLTPLPQFEISNFQFEIYSPGLTFEVTYPSGIILTEAPSIVETTHTNQQKRACDASAIRDSAPRVEFRTALRLFGCPTLRRLCEGWVFFGLFFFRVLRLSNFVPLASGRRLSLGLSPLALASLACHPACTEERSDRSGGISPCRRLSPGLCFFRLTVTRCHPERSRGICFCLTI